MAKQFENDLTSLYLGSAYCAYRLNPTMFFSSDMGIFRRINTSVCGVVCLQTTKKGLIDNCVTFSKFTAKSPLREFFKNLCHLRVVFTNVFLSSLLL